MKSLEELAAIRNKMKNKVALRENSGDIRIVVGMATCGIAAGARPVLNAFVEDVSKQASLLLEWRVYCRETGCRSGHLPQRGSDRFF